MTERKEKETPRIPVTLNFSNKVLPAITINVGGQPEIEKPEIPKTQIKTQVAETKEDPTAAQFRRVCINTAVALFNNNLPDAKDPADTPVPVLDSLRELERATKNLLSHAGFNGRQALKIQVDLAKAKLSQVRGLRDRSSVDWDRLSQIMSYHLTGIVNRYDLSRQAKPRRT